MWPSAVVLSRWLATNASVLQNKSVIELGAGCGLTGILAARLQQLSREPEIPDQLVCLTDFNPVVLENLKRNSILNDVSCEVAGLDFYQQNGQRVNGAWKDMNGETRQPFDVVLGADIICQPQDAVAAANTFHDILRPGGRAICVCADAAHRFGVDRLESECTRVGLSVKIEDVKQLQNGQLLGRDGLDCTAGYVEGMSLTMFFVDKPVL